eukprot:8556486-Pyramimonas_sp.AAC.1
MAQGDRPPARENHPRGEGGPHAWHPRQRGGCQDGATAPQLKSQARPGQGGQPPWCRPPSPRPDHAPEEKPLNTCA